MLAVPSLGRMSPPDHAAPPARPGRCRSSPSWASSRYASSATRGPQQRDAHSPDARPSRPSRPVRGHLADQARQQAALAGQLHALVAGPGDQKLSPVPHRRLAGSLARRQRRQNLISHRHDPSRPAAPSRGPSDHARYAKFLTGPRRAVGPRRCGTANSHVTAPRSYQPMSKLGDVPGFPWVQCQPPWPVRSCRPKLVGSSEFRI